MKANVKHAVVIPAYNERPSVRAVVEGVLRHVAEIIVVDDASTDHTAETLSDLPVQVLRNPVNEGKGASLWRGGREAARRGARWVITLDADGQHDPADLARLIAATYEYPDALIIGARTRHRESVPRRRAAANRLADFCVGWAAGQPIVDSQSGLRVYPAWLFENLRRPRKREGFAFESEVIIQAARQGVPIVGLPVDAHYPVNSRPSRYRPVIDSMQIMFMLLRQVVFLGFYPVGLYRSMSLRPRLLSEQDVSSEP